MKRLFLAILPIFFILPAHADCVVNYGPNLNDFTPGMDIPLDCTMYIQAFAGPYHYIQTPAPSSETVFYGDCSAFPVESACQVTMESIGGVGDYVMFDYDGGSVTHYYEFQVVGETPPPPAPELPPFPTFDIAIYDSCGTIDLTCRATTTFGFLFSYDETFIASNTDFLTYSLLHKVPVGYITSIVEIFATTTESPLTVIDATITPILGFGGQHVELSLAHVFDFALNATTSIYTNESASSTETLFQITDRYWKIILDMGLLIYVFFRVFPSLNKPNKLYSIDP
jgi:hypothetical protein